jgi:hypothetical protein
VFQILTDSQSWPYFLMRISAWIEVTGLIRWAIDLCRAMARRPDTASAAQPVSDPELSRNLGPVPGVRLQQDRQSGRAADLCALDQPRAGAVKDVDFTAFQTEFNGAIRKSCSGPTISLWSRAVAFQSAIYAVTCPVWRRQVQAVATPM